MTVIGIVIAVELALIYFILVGVVHALDSLVEAAREVGGWKLRKDLDR